MSEKKRGGLKCGYNVQYTVKFFVFFFLEKENLRYKGLEFPRLQDIQFNVQCKNDVNKHNMGLKSAIIVVCIQISKFFF